jgi:cytochrome c biogenesis protein CcmG/thiol:disulfide interchange protein DsbE
MVRWSKLALLVVAAVVGTQFLLRPQTVSSKSGERAPPLVLRDLSGRHVDLQALRGRVVLVNFWATWCPPCLAELPELAELWQEQRGQCFDLLGVAEQSPKQDLAAAARRIPYSVLSDPGGEVAEAWGVVGFPSSFIVDADGKVVRFIQGALTLQEAREALRPHLPAGCGKT